MSFPEISSHCILLKRVLFKKQDKKFSSFLAGFDDENLITFERNIY
jgi:hypothetical protein